MARVTRVDHTGISVSDVERSLRFYRDLLGMEVVYDDDVDDVPGLNAVVGMEAARGRVVWLKAGDSMVELWQWDHPAGRELPEGYRPADRGVTHVALRVDDVDAVHRAVVEAGHPATTEPVDLYLHKTTYVRGPDGEIVELLEDRVTPERLERMNDRARARRAAEGG